MNLLVVIRKNLVFILMLTLIIGISSNAYATCQRCTYDPDSGVARCILLVCISEAGHSGCQKMGQFTCQESGTTCSGSNPNCRLFNKEQFIKTVKYSPYVETDNDPINAEEPNKNTLSNNLDFSSVIKPVAHKIPISDTAQQLDDQGNTTLGKLRIDAKTILQIAEIHPRFALLAAGYLLDGQYFYIYARSKTTPVKVTSTDIKNLVDPNKESNHAYLEFEEKAKAVNRDAVRNNKIFFEVVTTTEITSKYPNQGTMRFVISTEIPGDPPSMTMTWRIKKDPTSKMWNVSEWQIN